MTRASKIPPPGSARLFLETEPPVPPAGVYVANVDGASRGNPGPAAYAVLLAVLDFATSHGVGALRIRSDSELLVRQMQGLYKVKSGDLQPLYQRAVKLTRQLPYFVIEHVRREQNRDADALANAALDSGNIFAADPSPAARPSANEAGPPQQASPAAPAQPTTAMAREPFSRIHFRARVVKGALVPFEPLHLPEGVSVDVELRIAKEE
jgi:ribonuclease HI